MTDYKKPSALECLTAWAVATFGTYGGFWLITVFVRMEFSMPLGNVRHRAIFALLSLVWVIIILVSERHAYMKAKLRSWGRDDWRTRK